MPKQRGHTLVELLLVAGVISLGMAGILSIGSMVLEKSRQEQAVAATLEIVQNVQQAFSSQSNFHHLTQNDAYFQGLFGPGSHMTEGRVVLPHLGDVALTPVDEPIQGQSVQASGFQLTLLGVPSHLCLPVSQALGMEAHRMQVGTVRMDGPSGNPDIALLSGACNQGREVRVAAVFIKHDAEETLSPCVAPTSAQQREVKCPAGKTGRQIQTRTGSCPGFYGDVQWTAWSTLSSTCVDCPTTELKTLSCPPGEYGSREAERSFDCEAETWGAWNILSQDCAPCPSEPNTRERECPSGQGGHILEEQRFFCTQGVWGAWVMVGNTCQHPTP